MSDSAPVPEAWPTEIILKRDERLLHIAFDDGSRFDLPAEYLRVQSPSAEVKGHNNQGRRTVAGKEKVALSGIEPVGNYAVRLIFDDGHATGLYSWPYLRTLGREQPERWQAYLTELAAQGLARGR